MNEFKNFYIKFLNLTINYFDKDLNAIIKSKVRDLHIIKRKQLFRKVMKNEQQK